LNGLTLKFSEASQFLKLIVPQIVDQNLSKPAVEGPFRETGHCFTGADSVIIPLSAILWFH